VLQCEKPTVAHQSNVFFKREDIPEGYDIRVLDLPQQLHLTQCGDMHALQSKGASWHERGTVWGCW